VPVSDIAGLDVHAGFETVAHFIVAEVELPTHAVAAIRFGGTVTDHVHDVAKQVVQTL